MNWEVTYLPEAAEDLRRLDGSQRLIVRKAIQKVSSNLVSVFDGGYGKPLGNKGSADLTGLFKIKIRNAGLRVVYKLMKQGDKMIIVVIGAMADEESL